MGGEEGGKDTHTHTHTHMKEKEKGINVGVCLLQSFVGGCHGGGEGEGGKKHTHKHTRTKGRRETVGISRMDMGWREERERRVSVCICVEDIGERDRIDSNR